MSCYWLCKIYPYYWGKLDICYFQVWLTSSSFYFCLLWFFYFWKINDENCQGLEWRMNILHVDHFCFHSDLWESYTLGIFPCINLFVNVFLVRTWNLLHMDVDTISKDQTGVFSKMHSIPFNSLLPNGLLLAMGFTYPPWNWLSWIDWAQQNIERLQDYTHI